MKQYKVLTLKEKFLPARFDPEALEGILNSHASEGWTVKAMATAKIRSFGQREELVVILEREERSGRA